MLIRLTVDGLPAIGRVFMAQLWIFWPGYLAFGEPPTPDADGALPASFWAIVAALNGTATTGRKLVDQGFQIVVRS